MFPEPVSACLSGIGELSQEGFRSTLIVSTIYKFFVQEAKLNGILPPLRFILGKTIVRVGIPARFCWGAGPHNIKTSALFGLEYVVRRTFDGYDNY